MKKHAAIVAADINEYINLESEILDRLLERAGISAAERASIAKTNQQITTRHAHG